VFTDEEKQIRTQYIASLSKAAEEFETQYILSWEGGKSAWNAWIERAKTLGARELEKISNHAQKRLDTIK